VSATLPRGGLARNDSSSAAVNSSHDAVVGFCVVRPRFVPSPSCPTIRGSPPAWIMALSLSGTSPTQCWLRKRLNPHFLFRPCSFPSDAAHAAKHPRVGSHRHDPGSANASPPRGRRRGRRGDPRGQTRPGALGTKKRMTNLPYGRSRATADFAPLEKAARDFPARRLSRRRFYDNCDPFRCLNKSPHRRHDQSLALWRPERRPRRPPPPLSNAVFDLFWTLFATGPNRYIFFRCLTEFLAFQIL
jgi:hypothetical protein